MSVCCRTPVPLGNLLHSRLPEIWASSERRALVDDLGAGTYPPGCTACGDEVAAEGREGAFLEQFDRWRRLQFTEHLDRRWPVRMDFNLSSSCNLQCVQCNGEFSTSIRIHRERLPPLPKPYGDQFFADVEPFIPHLRHAAFAGGEPFMASENFRMWELIERHAPGLDVTICTNATQMGDRVEGILARLRPQMIFSVDGYSEETYESIRVGARRDEVFANVERLAALTHAQGRTADVNFC